MRVLWVCNIMLPVIAQALSQEYSVREGWLSGILGRYLETENGAELSAADVTDSAASPGGRQQGAETVAALTLGHRISGCTGQGGAIAASAAWQL